MKHSPLLFVMIAVLTALPGRAAAQIVVIDDVILVTSRLMKRQQLTHEHLPLPGGESRLMGPGADTPRLGEERIGVAAVSGLLSTRRSAPSQDAARLRLLPLPTLRSMENPLYGQLELPGEEGETAEGLSLDDAIARLLAASPDLASKFQDIPKARADILTAGLRNNPFVFVSASNIPYQPYSTQRPGTANYDLTVIQPFDVSGKHKNAIRLAQQAENVMEAQFQDSVRLQIDKLYTAFADLLEAREAERAARSGVRGMEELVRMTRDLVRQGQRGQPELTTALIRQANAQDALQRTQAALLKARQNLAVLLALPPEQAGRLVIRGSLRVPAPSLPCEEELVQTALQVRPDLAAYRIGIERARADHQLARAEGIGNTYLFYTPYTGVDYAPQNKQNVNGWGVGVLLPMPLFNRNQGNVARTSLNIKQTQFEEKNLELQVVREVREAAAEYASSRAIVERYEREILEDARTLRDEKQRLYAKGQVALDAFLEARRDYNEVVRDYLEALVHRRRDGFKLDTAVGQRLVY
ncbi:MAG TPA: TolC family protein [Gemmataceae bacterium]|nr:TolC family protein [Gemmataceae bacterium]